MDFSDYKPSPEALKGLGKLDFVAVVGPTAAGKSSLMQAAVDRDPSLQMVITETSRQLRPGERDGIDIHIRTKEEMLERIKRREYVQVPPSLLGDLYATGPDDYPKEGVGMLAVISEALASFRALPFKSFRVVYIVPPSREVWEARLAKHGFTPDHQAKRIQEARRSLEYALEDPGLQFVVNGDLEQAAADFIALLKQEPLPPRLQADQTRAKRIIQEILASL